MSAYKDPKADALEYLKSNNLLRLFDILGAKMVFVKPDDPNQFLAEELRKVIDLRAEGKPVTLFSEEDISSMFTVFDITGRGYLTNTQYLKALNAVGVTNPKREVPKSNNIDKRTFVAYIYAEVLDHAFR